MVLSMIEQRIADILRTVAKKQKVIAYSELNQRVPLNLDLSLPPDRNLLSHWLGRILRYETEQGHPALPAVALYKGSTDPGPGFFIVVDDLGLRNPSEDDDAVHMRLLNAVYAYYKTNKSATP